MNCNDIASILDEHAQSRLTPTERCALDEHVAICESCALALRAQSALLALPMPATPAGLLGGVLRAVNSRAAPLRAPARARRLVVVGAVLAAGAALAAVTAVRLI